MKRRLPAGSLLYNRLSTIIVHKEYSRDTSQSARLHHRGSQSRNHQEMGGIMVQGWQTRLHE